MSYHYTVVSVQSLSHVRLFATPCTAACQASLSFTISRSLFKLMSIESMMPSNHLILCCPLLLLPSVFPISSVFPNDLALPIRWPKYWSFSFSICPFNEYWRLISLRIDWFDPYCPRDSQESSPAQFKSISSSVLSLLYGTTLTSVRNDWKTIALTKRTFVGKVMSLIFNMLSRFIIAFLPKSKCLLILRLQSLQWFWSPQNKICRCFHLK